MKLCYTVSQLSLYGGTNTNAWTQLPPIKHYPKFIIIAENFLVSRHGIIVDDSNMYIDGLVCQRNKLRKPIRRLWLYLQHQRQHTSAQLYDLLPLNTHI